MLQKTDSPVPPLLFFGGPYGNLQALTALRPIAEDLGLTPSSIVCTGDTVAYCAQPYETVEEIRRWGIQWELRRWMILLALPLRIYLKWKVKTEVRRMGEFVARERGRPSGEGVGFRMSSAKITWVSKKREGKTT